MGHLPRRVPLRGGPSALDREHGTRRRSRAPVGFRVEHRAVRGLAIERLVRGGLLGQRRHRRGQGALEGPPPRLGFRRQGREGGRRARAGRLLRASEGRVRSALGSAGVQASDFPREPGR